MLSWLIILGAAVFFGLLSAFMTLKKNSLKCRRTKVPENQVVSSGGAHLKIDRIDVCKRMRLIDEKEYLSACPGWLDRFFFKRLSLNAYESLKRLRCGGSNILDEAPQGKDYMVFKMSLKRSEESSVGMPDVWDIVERIEIKLRDSMGKSSIWGGEQGKRFKRIVCFQGEDKNTYVIEIVIFEKEDTAFEDFCLIS